LGSADWLAADGAFAQRRTGPPARSITTPLQLVRTVESFALLAPIDLLLLLRPALLGSLSSSR